MSLQDLNEDLYNSSSKDVTSRTHEKSDYDPDAAASQSVASPFDKEQVWNKPKKSITSDKKKLAIIIASILGGIVLIVAGFLVFRWWQKDAFNQDRVEIYIEGPEEADSAKINKYIIHYKNNNRVTLKDVEIKLNHSENFKPAEDNLNFKALNAISGKIYIGNVESKKEGTVEVKGSFYAPENFPVYLYASINFVPSNGKEQLSRENQISVKITAAPVTLNISAPEQAVEGYEMSYVINYESIDSAGMGGLQIKAEFPEDFRLNSALPWPLPSEKESIWEIGSLGKNEGGQITIKGQFYGDNGTEKRAVFSLGRSGDDGKFVVFSQQQAVTKIVLPTLSVRQSVKSLNGEAIKKIVNAGDILKYEIVYKNNNSVGVRDAVVTAEIKSRIIDFTNIRSEKSFYYNEKNNTITWTAADIPELANINPKGEGKIAFSVPVKTWIPIENKDDKNLSVSSLVKIDSPDIPVTDGDKKAVGSDKLELKLASKIYFYTNAFFTDSNIKNYGPIPMKVGKETTFAVHWRIDSISSDLTNAKVEGLLPTGVKWTGQTFPANEKIIYNDRTNKVTWEAGDIVAGTGALNPKKDGFLNPMREVVFQVAITPQATDVGRTMIIVKEAIFTAKDMFVEKDVRIEEKKKDTQLPEDPSVGHYKSKVEE